MKKTPFFQRIKAFICSKNMNESLTTSSAMKKELQIGEFVIHTPTNARGYVHSIDRVGKSVTVTITDTFGKIVVRGAARQEFCYAQTERYSRY